MGQTVCQPLSYTAVLAEEGFLYECSCEPTLQHCIKIALGGRNKQQGRKDIQRFPEMLALKLAAKLVHGNVRV